MNPKALSGLDPKLRETYERVMGTTSAAAKPASPPTSINNPAPSDSFFTSTSPVTSTPQSPAQDTPGATPAEQTPTTHEATSSTPSVAPATTTIPPTEPTVQQVDLSPTPSTSPSTMSPSNNSGSSATLGTTGTTNPFGSQNQTSALSFTQPLPSPASVNGSTPHEISTVVKVLYIFGAIAFFTAYTFFWIKIFNYQFPF